MNKRIALITDSAKQTESLGEMIGRSLKGGEIFELKSDLGGGKTTLTRGILAGTGSKDDVTSPTFTVSNEYRSDSLLFRHYDFYRLPELGLMAEELQETIEHESAVIIIEWAGDASNFLPVERHIVLQIVNTQSESQRRIEIEYPNEMAYVFEGVEHA